MHTVIAAECTGCDLCLPPCPVDCIEMVVKRPSAGEWARPRPESSTLYSAAAPARYSGPV
jgi:electron transport complex protein RnfB